MQDPNPEPNPPEPKPLEPERLTWAVLLAQWVEFARSSVALPESGQAGLVRQSVTDIITLQAVWFALGQMDELAADQRGIGIDRAGVLIRRHAGAIRARFVDESIPVDLADLLEDVQEAYEKHQQDDERG